VKRSRATAREKPGEASTRRRGVKSFAAVQVHDTMREDSDTEAMLSEKDSGGYTSSVLLPSLILAGSSHTYYFF
jgi:hypothetical protein